MILRVPLGRGTFPSTTKGSMSVEETKRRKIENLNESKEQTNGNLEKAGEKSSVQSSQKKQQKGSVEVCRN